MSALIDSLTRAKASQALAAQGLSGERPSGERPSVETAPLPFTPAVNIPKPAPPSETATARSRVNDPAVKVIPPVPRSIADLGIPAAILEHLALKYLYFRGEVLGRDLGKRWGCPSV